MTGESHILTHDCRAATTRLWQAGSRLTKSHMQKAALRIEVAQHLTMKKNRIIFYIIFALFHLGAFIFTLVLSNDSGFMVSMIGWRDYFKWITLLGLALLLVDVIWAWVSIKEHQREKAALAHEVNTLKAKLFDMQEDQTKRASNQGPLNPPPAH